MSAKSGTIEKQSDAAISHLADRMTTVAEEDLGSMLWVADEHPIPLKFFTAANKNSVEFLTNRLDQHLLATGKKLNSHFSDIELNTAKNKPFANIFFRVAKERSLVHQLINEAHAHLKQTGSLWLSGYKNEGIKTHISRAESCFGSKAEVSKFKNQLFIARMRKQSCSPELLDTNNYTELRQINVGGMTVLSKPGLYGWEKCDEASRFLMDWVSEQQGLLANKKILDLGCGYGYLSLRALKLGAREIVATDNCSAAIIACEANLKSQSTKAVQQQAHITNVIPSDAGNEINTDFDVVLCNPPFHQGFKTTPDLHEKFLNNTRRFIQNNGKAWYVVNQFLALDQVAISCGISATEVARSKSYKIIQLS